MVSSRRSSPVTALTTRTLVDRADADPDIQPVVFTETHPDRFVSHVEVPWLQGGATVPRSGEDPEPSRYR
jgi:hypothetical protein